MAITGISLSNSWEQTWMWPSVEIVHHWMPALSRWIVGNQDETGPNKRRQKLLKRSKKLVNAKWSPCVKTLFFEEILQPRMKIMFLCRAWTLHSAVDFKDQILWAGSLEVFFFYKKMWMWSFHDFPCSFLKQIVFDDWPVSNWSGLMWPHPRAFCSSQSARKGGLHVFFSQLFNGEDLTAWI